VKRIPQTRLEWILLGIIAVVCAVLSFLQYRWTGDVSRAERARLRSGLDEQVRQFVRVFDNQIRESCTILLPDAHQIREAGREQAHKTRYVQWTSSQDRSLFSRIGVAAPENGALPLFLLDHEGRMTPAEWPADWRGLRDAMADRANDTGPPPAAPRLSTIVQAPVFADGPHRGPRRELEWMIFEVNEDFLRKDLLPRLAAEYLNPGGEVIYELSVNWAGPGGGIVFSTRADRSSVAHNADATARIFPTEVGSSPGRGRGHFREQTPPSRWELAVRHRAGSLDAVVAQAQRRNLLTSLVLIGLLGGAAWLLVRYTARSRRLSEMQFRFAAGVSHDLRTPLTAIRGAAFNLASGVVQEPAATARYGNLILRNAEELTSMIENVLAFSASLHSRTENRNEAFDVGDLLEHAAEALAQEIEQAGCRSEVTIEPGLPAVAGDSVALELAFRNLIGNAVRHAAEGKWIGVSAAKSRDGVEVRVSDRGPGIPEGERARIFEPFVRGENTSAVQVRGTGLGLSLVKDTVERHRGTVSVDNLPGGGAQFTIYLPAIPEAS
jgi:signal transduction histidine kinase